MVVIICNNFKFELKLSTVNMNSKKESEFGLDGGGSILTCQPANLDKTCTKSDNICSRLQLFVLSSDVLMSLVELPALAVPGGGVTAGLVTAPSQVRVILRDLAGKACWDASILYCTPEQLQYKGTQGVVCQIHFVVM